MDVSARLVAGALEREVDALVASRLTRDENPRRQRRRGLGDAIKESILPIAEGRNQYGVGIRITDQATLSRIALYWHAIEVGSDHIVGIRVVGFGVRRRGRMTVSRLTPPGQATRQPDALASKTRGVTVKRPITGHRYLETISTRAAARFSARVGVDLQRAFS
jgi:hypothetical protein